jgi:hypothetical protein
MEGHTMKLKDVDEVLKAARAGDESCRTLFTKLSPHLLMPE